jgi:sulfur carrier protein ThiS
MGIVTVQIGEKTKKIQAGISKTLEDLMNKLGISPEEYICVVNGGIVTEKEKFSQKDKIRFVKVWSGG